MIGVYSKLLLDFQVFILAHEPSVLGISYPNIILKRDAPLFPASTFSYIFFRNFFGQFSSKLCNIYIIYLEMKREG